MGTFLAPFPRPYARAATIVVGGHEADVVVSIRQSTSTRDGRHSLDGILWSEGLEPNEIRIGGKYILRLDDGSDMSIAVAGYSVSLSDEQFLITAEFMAAHQLLERP